MVGGHFMEKEGLKKICKKNITIILAILKVISLFIDFLAYIGMF